MKNEEPKAVSVGGDQAVQVNRLALSLLRQLHGSPLLLAELATLVAFGSVSGIQTAERLQLFVSRGSRALAEVTHEMSALDDAQVALALMPVTGEPA